MTLTDAQSIGQKSQMLETTIGRQLDLVVEMNPEKTDPENDTYIYWSN